MLQQQYAQLVEYNDRKSKEEKTDGYDMMMRYVREFKTFLDKEREKGNNHDSYLERQNKSK